MQLKKQIIITEKEDVTGRKNDHYQITGKP